MTNKITDSRVLQSFLSGIPRQYMIAVEQRLTSASEFINNLSKNGPGPDIRKKIQTGSGGFTTTSTTYVDTSLEVNMKSRGGRPVLLFFCWDDFWIAGGTVEYAYVAVSRDRATEEVLAVAYKNGTNANTYGVCATAAWTYVPAGNHTYTIRAKTTGGTLYLGGSNNKLLLAVMEF